MPSAQGDKGNILHKVYTEKNVVIKKQPLFYINFIIYYRMSIKVVLSKVL